MTKSPDFEFECPRTWDSLARTSDPDVRHCDSCRHLVHRVQSDAELAAHAARGHCVSVLPDPYTWPANAMRTGRPKTKPTGAGTSWLVMLSGPQKDAVLVLVGGAITIGRGPADIVLDDPTLAPQQIRITREGGNLRYCDLTTPDEPPRDLGDGDIIAIGDARAVFKTVADGTPFPDPLF
jgi:hypothetical protein